MWEGVFEHGSIVGTGSLGPPNVQFQLPGMSLVLVLRVIMGKAIPGRLYFKRNIPILDTNINAVRWWWWTAAATRQAADPIVALAPCRFAVIYDEGIGGVGAAVLIGNDYGVSTRHIHC